MSSHLRKDLAQIEDALLQLSGRAEDALRRSYQAIMRRDLVQAEEIVAGDSLIDRMEVDLEEVVLRAMALHQPVAGDLRFLTSVLKINSDLERIADLAVNVAKRVPRLLGHEVLPAPEEFGPMVDVVISMVRDALDAFVASNVTICREVLRRDNEVDRMNTTICDDMVNLMKSAPACVEDALLYIFCARSFERVADHATNIAEDVIYMVSGEIVRHSGGERRSAGKTKD